MKYLRFEDIILKKIKSNEPLLPKDDYQPQTHNLQQKVSSELNNYSLNFSETGHNLKTVLGFCRAIDIYKSKSSRHFYFHVAEVNWQVRNFPDSVLDANFLFLYSGGRSINPHFTGHYARIKSVQIKHKSNIKGKENSNTEYYCELKLESCFKRHEKINAKIEPTSLFGSKKNSEFLFFQERLPALTSLSKILELNGIETL